MPPMMTLEYDEVPLSFMDMTSHLWLHLCLVPTLVYTQDPPVSAA